MTHHYDERSGTGVWSRPDVPVLIFSDSTFTKPFTYHNGALGGGTPPQFLWGSGTPVQLIFWGDWWLWKRGTERRQFIESQTQALLDSPYFDELAQYHIHRRPVWRGSMVVTAPDPPGPTGNDATMAAVMDMIDALEDDDRIPDPDDGQVIYITLMPDGFWVTDNVLGAHSTHYYWDFWPTDENSYWAGWVEQPDTLHIDDVMVTLSHELVEILTDPELDGWHTDPMDDHFEIADITDSNVGGNSVQQAAWVNDVKVTSYWSNRHNACVIPIDRDYAALLTYHIAERNRTVTTEGTFRPSDADRAACPQVPQCCIEDRDYRWAEYDVTERAHIELQHERYRLPYALWNINGHRIVHGTDTLTLRVAIDQFNGRDTVATTKEIQVDYDARPRTLELTVTGARGNFDLHVGCSVYDTAFIGNTATEPVATPEAMIGFVCAAIEVEQSYLDQVEACLRALLQRYTEQHVPTGRALHRDPINYDPGIESAGLPAYARITQYQQVRRLRTLIHAVNHLLDADSARLVIDNLMARVPALSGAMQRQANQRTDSESAAIAD